MHDIVDAVQELGPERGTQSFHGFSASALGIVARKLKESRRTNVAGHHQHRIAEIDLASLAVGQPAVFENLQENVEDVRMRFLDLVKQNYRVRTPPHLFC